MRSGYVYSLLFALFANVSLAAVAAPVAPSVVNPHQGMEVVSKTQSDKVDLNRADAATLQRELAGVGDAKAKAIIAYRESNGPFSSVDQLLEVKGIGKAIVDKNREKIEVN